MNAQEKLEGWLNGKGIKFEVARHAHPVTIQLQQTSLAACCKFLVETEGLYFDQLSNVTGVDNGLQANSMEVIYHLYSIPFNHSLALKVVLPRENPEVDSLSGIWKSANWLEREVYDMFGIRFKNHPDLRRILMPNDWVGYPLRKDYQQEDTYHEVKIAY
jgi:NADH-quinone oxidoreductase subunit C